MFAKKLNTVHFAVNSLIAGLGLLASVSTQAAIYGGVDFPGGASSFADAVVSYDPTLGGASGPQTSARDPLQALGIPTGRPNYGFVTLGDGGQITLRFTNNSLTGSGSSALDLWIFEVGPDVRTPLSTSARTAPIGFLLANSRERPQGSILMPMALVRRIFSPTFD